MIFLFTLIGVFAMGLGVGLIAGVALAIHEHDLEHALWRFERELERERRAS